MKKYIDCQYDDFHSFLKNHSDFMKTLKDRTIELFSQEYFIQKNEETVSDAENPKLHLLDSTCFININSESMGSVSVVFSYEKSLLLSLYEGYLGEPCAPEEESDGLPSIAEEILNIVIGNVLGNVPSLKRHLVKISAPDILVKECVLTDLKCKLICTTIGFTKGKLVIFYCPENCMKCYGVDK